MLQAVAAVVPVGIVYMDETGLCRYANNRFRVLLACGDGEVVGGMEAWPQRVHAEDRERVLELGQRFSAGNDVFDSEFRLLRGEDEPLWVHCQAVIDRRDDGSIRGYAAVVGDISARRRGPELLKDLALALSPATGDRFFKNLTLRLSENLGTDYALVGRLTDGRADRVRTIAVCDHGRIVENFEYELAGAPCEHVIGKVRCCYVSGVRERFPADQLLVEMNIESYAGVPLFTAAGETLGLLVVMDGEPLREAQLVESTLEIFASRASAELERDRAERSLARHRAELEQLVERRTNELSNANAEFQAFCYAVAHDLRSPLRVIDGFSHGLLEGHSDQLDAEARDALGRVRGASQRMGGLIDDLLSLSRVARGEIQRENTDLSEIVAEILAALAGADPERKVDRVVAADVEALADPVLLRVVLRNLLENSWKFTRGREATIEFGVSESGKSRVYFVRDNGVGFDMAYVDKLFSPFQRLHAAEEFEGSGIGLATAEKIVRRHGGRIWAEAAVGRGASFFFTLGDDDSPRDAVGPGAA